MRARRLCNGLAMGVLGACCLAVTLHGAATRVAEAARDGDRDGVRTLLKQGADVNEALGDGVTALHWAARHGDAEMARLLLLAGGSALATTRSGRFTPLHLAAERGSAPVIVGLLGAGADANARTSTGATPLMLASGTGEVAALGALLDAGADPNAAETFRGQTALMWAAAANHVAAVKLLIAKGADPNKATKVLDFAALSRDGSNPDGRNLPTQAAGRDATPTTGLGAGPAQAPAARRVAMPGVDRTYLINELVYAQGGFAPIHYAVRDGHAGVVSALLAAGVNVNTVTGGDRTSPLLVATVNGHFDIGKMLLEQGADPNLAGENGATPLYAAINVQWAAKAAYPQPTAQLNQHTGYLDYMRLLLDKGADPNQRVNKKVWYSEYNFDQSGVDEVGATAFWRAAYAADVDAMKLLVSYGADPNIPSIKPPGRPQTGDAGARDFKDVSGLPPIVMGGPAVPAIIAAAGAGYGEGFAANSRRHAPHGMLAAVKYLVEELHADPNARDHEGNSVLHNAAARGDNEMILFLVSKGADVTVVNREGQTTADMANGPVQRTQPFPETLALLAKLGARNNNKCLSC
ncbi:MAG TPA: ankyrin repeat domain-containing protein [Vicinamibacterales bacterium]|nr:ankyrin repeat domain-containing protein [Vicinamibacterales bacterium]